MAQTLTSILVHIIFSTKNRDPLIPLDFRDNIFRYIGGIAAHHASPLLAAGGVQDHVHLLVSLSKTIALAPLVMDIKKDSSKWIKHEHPTLDGFHWQDGYAAFSIGESQVPALRAYFEKQEEHHRQVAFQDELRAFLRKYNVEFDERYIWT